ncbi:MAG TPA: phage baseplate assembly protein V [Myxococcales bacterium]|nr:phage baseplate assembly protein V [Myxococcales bacterium]
MHTFYEILQGAKEAAVGADSNRYGVEIGVVTNVQDPQQLGRIRVQIPRLPGGPEGDWARVAQPAAGAGRGFYWLPEVGDEVLIAFELGQPDKPYVIGCLWNGKDKPMNGAYQNDNSTRMIQTKSGHQVILCDKSGDEKIVIADKSGKRTITFDVKNKKFVVEDGEGDIEMHAKKKIVLECEDLEIKTSKTTKIDVGDKFSLNVSADATIKADGKLQIKATRVNIN